MKTLTYILFISLIIFSCKGEDTETTFYASKEDSLFCQLIDSLILPDSTWRKFLLVPPPFYPDDFSKSELKHQRDSLLQRWDTAQLYIAFDDTLLLFSNFFNLDKNSDTLSYFRNNLENLDSSYYDLFKKCLQDTTLKKRKINIEKFRTNFNYKVIIADSVQKMSYHGFLVVEINRFSRIIFNEKCDKACFCQTSKCGGECGGGYMIFLEKKNNKWSIKERKLLFVS